MNREPLKSDALAFTYSFPFWIYIDRRYPPELAMVKIGDLDVRAYPPFRSAPSNWLPMPYIDPEIIPFLKNRKPKGFSQSDPLISKTATFIPLLNIDWIDGEGASAKISFAPDKKWDNPPKGFPMDSLRLDFISKQGNNYKPSIGRKFSSLLIRNLRVESGQWWITRSTDALQGWIRHSIPIDAYGTPIATSQPFLRGQTASGFEAAITDSIWRLSLTNAAHDIEPPLYKELYLDALYFNAQQDFRRMTLDAANACEILKDHVVEQLWKIKYGKKYKRGKFLKGYDLAKHLHAPIKELCGRSFREDDQASHAAIAKLWNARNNVAHTKDAYYINEFGKQINIDKDNSSEFIASVRSCISWLEGFT